jgi:hypothetical protein
MKGTSPVSRLSSTPYLGTATTSFYIFQIGPYSLRFLKYFILHNKIGFTHCVQCIYRYDSGTHYGITLHKGGSILELAQEYSRDLFIFMKKHEKQQKKFFIQVTF